jgi:hypothetical protein
LLTVLRTRNAGSLENAPLTPQLINSLSADRARAAYRRIAALGEPSNAAFIETDETGTRIGYRYRVAAGKRLFLWRISVDDEGRIAEMSLEEEE